MLENGGQLCVTIGLAQCEECEISLDRDTSLVERFSYYVLGLGLRDKQQIVVFAADLFEVEAPNPLPVPVKAEREPMVSKFLRATNQGRVVRGVPVSWLELQLLVNWSQVLFFSRSDGRGY